MERLTERQQIVLLMAATKPVSPTSSDDDSQPRMSASELEIGLAKSASQLEELEEQVSSVLVVAMTLYHE